MHSALHRAARSAVGFCAGQAFAQQRDLPGVMRLVLANVKPLAEVVGRSPRPALVGGKKPRIILFAEFGQRLLPYFVQNADVIFAIVALDSRLDLRRRGSSQGPTSS